MEFRVEQLAAESGVPVDTIRFYQGRRLLPAPRREGRVAIYDDGHLQRLRRIRALLAEGFKLSQIRKLLGRDSTPAAGAPRSEREGELEPLLAALAQEGVGARSFTRAELASESGVPEALLASVQRVGLLEPVIVGEQERFSVGDLEMCRAGLAMLAAGLPLPELLQLATQHARNVEAIAQSSIDLFDDYVRKADTAEAAGGTIEAAFRTLLPQVTRLVALHFQRTLVRRAIERLRASDDAAALEEALAATESVQLEVAWR